MSPLESWSTLRKQAEEASKEFTPLEDDVYSFVVKDEPKYTENNGTPTYSIRATVESGPRQNANIIHYFNYNSNSAWAAQNFFFEPLAQLGLDGAFFDSNPNNNQIIQKLHGVRFTAEVFVDNYNPEKPKKKLRNFAPAGATASAGVPTPGPAPAQPQQQQAQAPQAPAPTPPQPETQAPAQPPVQEPQQEQTQAQPQQAPPSPWGNTAPPPPPAL